jgi:hypothetical protein
MVLGTYTFAANPNAMTLIQKEKDNASVRTYTSVAYFDWGASYAGKKLELTWDKMTAGQYDSLMALSDACEQVVFDPQDEEDLTFNVEILELTGEYHVNLGVDDRALRKDVKMTLLIMSEVES